jgi:hypothetical protein
MKQTFMQKHFAGQRSIRIIKIIDAALVFILVANIALVIISNGTVDAQTSTTPPPPSTIYAETQKALADLEAAKAKLDGLLTQTDAAAAKVIETAVDQAFTSAGVNSNNLTSPSALNKTVATQLVEKALADALASGATSLTQMTSINVAPTASVESLVQTAIKEGLASGGINLNQITNISLANPADIDKLVNSALNEAISGGGINLSQINSISNLNDAQLKNVISSALSEAVSSGIGLTPAQQQIIMNNALPAIKSLSGPVDLATLKNTLATQFIAANPSLTPTAVTSVLGTLTDKSFGSVIQEKLIKDALTSVSGLSGTVDFSSIKNAIGNTSISLTGLGSLSGISASIDTASLKNFTNLVQGGVFNQTLASLKTLPGNVNLSNIQDSIANSVLASTGLGSITSIKASFGALTSDQFKNTVKDAVVGQALASIGIQTGTFDLNTFKNTIGTNILNTTGLGSLAGITTSLTSLDSAAIKTAIKNSIIQNTLGGFGGLTNLSSDNIKQLIGNQILSITGTGNLINIASSIQNNITQAIANIAGVKGQIEGALKSITSAFDGLKNLSFNLDGLKNLDIKSLTNMFSSLTNIQGLITDMVSKITGPLTSAIGSITSIASQINLSGIASLTNLTSLTGSLSSVTGSISSITNITSGIGGTSLTSGLAGLDSAVGATSGMPFGGMSGYVHWCTCTMNYAISLADYTIAPPVALPLLYQPGATQVFAYGQIMRSGVFMLGLWSPGGVCTYYVGKACAPYPVAGTMTMVGTSM